MRDAAECLDDNINVVVHLDVIKTDEAWLVVDAIQCSRLYSGGIEDAQLIFGVDRSEVVLDIVERLVSDFIVIRQTEYSRVVQVDEHVMVCFECV